MSPAAIQRVHVCQYTSQPGVGDVACYKVVSRHQHILTLGQQSDVSLGWTEIEKVYLIGHCQDIVDIVL